jgi:hypothetical protein
MLLGMYRDLRFLWRLGAFAGLVSSGAFAAGTMSVAQQNAMVQTYCAVCHTDASMNGGVSLQHFNAATAAPSLKAMLLSKITGGALLETVQAAPTKGDAAEFVGKRLKTGAMAASGVPEPDLATMLAFAYSLAKGSARANEWTVEPRQDGPANMDTVTASILREVPSDTHLGSAESYRLIVACNAATRQGTMQVAWSPAAQTGKLTATVDSKAPVSYVVEGKENMGDGKGGITNGLAAIYVSDANTSLALPAKSLAVSDLFPGDVITFPFADLPRGTRKELAACFPDRTASR